MSSYFLTFRSSWAQRAKGGQRISRTIWPAWSKGRERGERCLWDTRATRRTGYSGSTGPTRVKGSARCTWQPWDQGLTGIWRKGWSSWSKRGTRFCWFTWTRWTAWSSRSTRSSGHERGNGATWGAGTKGTARTSRPSRATGTTWVTRGSNTRSSTSCKPGVYARWGSKPYTVGTR